MAVDVVFNVRHAAVANFYGVAVEDLVKHVVPWKFLI